MTAVPISLDVAEDAVEAHLRKWLPDYLGKAVAANPDLQRVDAADIVPQTWGRADDWPGNLDVIGPLPAVFLTSGGTNGEAVYQNGVRSELALFGVRVVGEHVRHGDQVIGCNRLTRLYHFALTNLFEQRGYVTDSVRIEDVLGAELATDENRGLALLDVDIACSVATASTDLDWLTDPTWGDAPREPDELIDVESVDVITEPA